MLLFGYWIFCFWLDFNWLQSMNLIISLILSLVRCCFHTKWKVLLIVFFSELIIITIWNGLDYNNSMNTTVDKLISIEWARHTWIYFQWLQFIFVKSNNEKFSRFFIYFPLNRSKFSSNYFLFVVFDVCFIPIDCCSGGAGAGAAAAAVIQLSLFIITLRDWDCWTRKRRTQKMRNWEEEVSRRAL